MSALFLVNIVVDIMLKEHLETDDNIHDSNWSFVKTCIITIVIFFLFELKRNFVVCLILMFMIFSYPFVFSLLSIQQLQKVQILFKYISEKIIIIGIKIIPIIFFIYILMSHI